MMCDVCIIWCLRLIMSEVEWNWIFPLRHSYPIYSRRGRRHGDEEFRPERGCDVPMFHPKKKNCVSTFLITLIDVINWVNKNFVCTVCVCVSLFFLVFFAIFFFWSSWQPCPRFEWNLHAAANTHFFLFDVCHFLFVYHVCTLPEAWHEIWLNFTPLSPSRQQTSIRSLECQGRRLVLASASKDSSHHATASRCHASHSPSNPTRQRHLTWTYHARMRARARAS